MSTSSDQHDANDARPIAAVILAAGKGTRMNSDLPKVAHEVAGRAMVWWVVEAAREIGANPIVLVVGYGRDAVRAVFDGDDSDLRLAVQAEQHGTGHAVRCAKAELADFHGDVLILCGDGPLIRAETLRTLLETHRNTSATLTLATAVLDEPGGYGRIVRDADGRFAAIVEEKVATPEQRAIREINPSYYVCDSARLFKALDEVTPNEVTNEYYVTDVPAILLAGGATVEVVDAVLPGDVHSINTPAQLAEVDAILAERTEART